MNKVVMVVAIFLMMTGCASIQTLNNAEPISKHTCQVKVFSSLESAKSKGVIEELCIVTGTSSGSFSHTVATAIKKHKDKVCKCGADNVYIQAQDAGTLGTASVTLVGFRYINKNQPEKATLEIFELAKKCQEKGGVWINDICQIQLN